MPSESVFCRDFVVPPALARNGAVFSVALVCACSAVPNPAFAFFSSSLSSNFESNEALDEDDADDLGEGEGEGDLDSADDPVAAPSFSLDDGQKAALLDEVLDAMPTWFKPYGFLRLDVIFNSARMDHPQGSMWVLSEDPDLGVLPDDRELTIYARESRIGISLGTFELGKDRPKDQRWGIDGKFEVDFTAGGREALGEPGVIMVAICLTMFAFSTILGWSYYGEKCLAFLLNGRAVRPYRMLFVIAAFAGSMGKLDLVWGISDIMNGLMALPNLVGLVLLSGVIVAETRDYLERQRSG